MVIGAFIKERRKIKKLTQSQLGAKLMVSEKTVSKWECGNGFPDATLILPLCEVLEINANELLSGKLLEDDKEYKTHSEDNIVKIKAEQEKATRFLLSLEVMLGMFSIIILMGSIVISAYIEMPTFARVGIIVLGAIICMIGLHHCMIIEKDAGFYECKHCHHKHIPTLKQMYFARHMGRTRIMKCPKCGKKDWQRKVITK